MSKINNQISLLERKLETGDVKNLYSIKNKLKILKRKQIKENYNSGRETKFQFLAR